MTDELNGNEEQVLAEFLRRLVCNWLPAYCHDERRRYSIDGFRSDFKLAAVDARDFIVAVDLGLIVDHGGGRWRAPRSSASEVIFWEGRKDVEPRPITLWIEPIITAAVLARLCRDFGWPRESLGMQSRDWAFDVVAYRTERAELPWISIEVKKTSRELETLIAHMQALCTNPDTVTAALASDMRNAAKKWLALATSRPALFWAVGPDGLNTVFRLVYTANCVSGLIEVDADALHYTAMQE